MPDSRSIRVLLVEDNLLDARSTINAAAKIQLANEIEHVTSGEAALERLAERPRPELVLLDLNLPGLDGRAVLDAMRSDDDLRSIPVVVLTSSASTSDVEAAYGLGANAYVTKPVGLAGWVDVVQAIDGFWFSIATVPGDATDR